MEFQISEKQKMLVQGMRDLLTKEFPKDYFRKLLEKEEWPWEPMKKLGELGYVALGVPTEFGGLGGDTMDVTLCIEEANRIMGGPAMAYFTTVCFGARAVALFGTEKQKGWLLEGLMAGTKYVALSLTEPDGGTDMLAMKARGVADGKGNWVLNGQKIFTTGAHVADYIIAVVRTGNFEKKGAKGITMFLVPTNAKGLTITRIPLHIQESTGANNVYFDNVVVPDDHVFGELDRGVYTLFGVLNDERIGAAASALGLTQGAFDETLQYAKDRHAFGRPIGQFQAVQHDLAECWMKIQAARLMVYQAAWLQSKELPAEMESSAAKYIASVTQMEVTDKCMDILGGYCATKEFFTPMAHATRFTFAPVVNNAVKNFIGEKLGLPKSY
jgi:acyl-CoA dehydrogenase